MIISHKHQFAFFRNPRTGSTTAELMLRLAGIGDVATPWSGDGIPAAGLDDAFLEKWRIEQRELETKDNSDTRVYLMHLTPTDAVQHGLITEDELESYACFAYLRNPLERAVSSFRKLRGPDATPEAFREYLSLGLGSDLLLEKPQVDYFFHAGEQVTIPLDFHHFEQELRILIGRLGGYSFPMIPHLNSYPAWFPKTRWEDFYDRDSKQIVRSHYDVDLRFWREEYVV